MNRSAIVTGLEGQDQQDCERVNMFGLFLFHKSYFLFI